MGKNSNIEWCDHTFNHVRGCTPVSEGCLHCYAKRLSMINPKLLGEWGQGKPRIVASEAMWWEPVKWNNYCVTRRGSLRHVESWSEGDRRARVFCASLADWLDPEIPAHVTARLLGLIANTSELDWLLLTKRPELWRAALCASFASTDDRGLQEWIQRWLDGVPPHNVWLGASVENQKWATQRIPWLLKIPACVRFLSCEPLLDRVDLEHVVLPGERCECCEHPVQVNCLTGRMHCHGACDGPRFSSSIHWVIAGGESGPGARTCHVDHVRSLVRQCEDAGVPCLVKQLGADPFFDESDLDSLEDRKMRDDGSYRFDDRKGGDMSEWPEDLRVRKFPRIGSGVAA